MNLCAKFGYDLECLSMIQMHLGKVGSLKVKEYTWHLILDFDVIYGILSL